MNKTEDRGLTVTQGWHGNDKAIFSERIFPKILAHGQVVDEPDVWNNICFHNFFVFERQPYKHFETNKHVPFKQVECIFTQHPSARSRPSPHDELRLKINYPAVRRRCRSVWRTQWVLLVLWAPPSIWYGISKYNYVLGTRNPFFNDYLCRPLCRPQKIVSSSFCYFSNARRLCQRD